jgi:hypothetical protein
MLPNGSGQCAVASLIWLRESATEPEAKTNSQQTEKLYSKTISKHYERRKKRKGIIKKKVR